MYGGEYQNIHYRVHKNHHEILSSALAPYLFELQFDNSPLCGHVSQVIYSP
jgi:hypothetical protein